MELLSGKVAVVTGASSGIGRAIAEKLVKNGVKVVGLARRLEKLIELSLKLQGEKGDFHAVKADLTVEDEVIKAFEWTQQNVGVLSFLINSAGCIQQTSLFDGEMGKWKKIFDTNVLGLCVCTREAVKVMLKNGIPGHVVHVNSVFGHKVVNIPGLNVYPASKFAVTALGETLRNELRGLGAKIKITSVSPGYVETEFLRTKDYQINEELRTMLEGRVGLKGDNVAEAVMFCLTAPEHVEISELTLQPIQQNLICVNKDLV